MAEFSFEIDVNPDTDTVHTIEHNLNSSAVRVNLTSNKKFSETGVYRLYEFDPKGDNSLELKLFAGMFNAGKVQGKVLTF